MDLPHPSSNPVCDILITSYPCSQTTPRQFNLTNTQMAQNIVIWSRITFRYLIVTGKIAFLAWQLSNSNILIVSATT